MPPTGRVARSARFFLLLIGGPFIVAAAVSIAAQGVEPKDPLPTQQTPASGSAVAGPAISFEKGASGIFARVVFATGANGKFSLKVEDLSFPPDGQQHLIVLPAAAVLELRSEAVTLAIGGRRVDRDTPRVAVPAGLPITVVNSGELAAVVRVYLVAAKGR